jgi:hypothetical protein
MSWRIEHANPFALVRDLPDELFQTCLLRVPRDLPDPYLFDLVYEVHRVLRDDGTLWIGFAGLGAPAGRLHFLEAAGWLRPDRDAHAGRQYRCLQNGRSLFTLFAKQPSFHFNYRPPLLSQVSPCGERTGPDRRERLISSSQARRAWCVSPGGPGVPSRAIEWCIHASTSPCGCGICGAAWRRFPGAKAPERRWRPGCEHGYAHGRCLVLDPFCGLGEVALAAVRLGRGFLGIERDFATALRATARVVNAEIGPLR